MRPDIWRIRGLLYWLVIDPSEVFPTETFGCPNCTRLKRLKASARNSKAALSWMGKFLKSEMSQLAVPGVRSALSVRDSLPNATGLKTGFVEMTWLWKQAVLKYVPVSPSAGPRRLAIFPLTFLLQPETTSGLCVPWNA